MSDAHLRLLRIFRELKHRNVFRVALQVAGMWSSNPKSKRPGNVSNA